MSRATVRGGVPERELTFRAVETAALQLVSDAPPAPASLYLDLDDAALSGAWVTIRFADAGSGAYSRVGLTAVSRASAGLVSTTLAGDAYGGGRFSWTGRLPESLVRLEAAPLAGEDAFSLDGFSIERRSRASLLMQAAFRRPWPTLTALGWRAVGYRVRSRHHLARALATRGATGYDAWVARYDTLTGLDHERLRAEAEAYAEPPSISVVMPVYNPTPAVLSAALDSVRAQIYPHWELCLCDDASTDPKIRQILDRAVSEEPRIKLHRRAENGHIARATNDALALASGSYIAFMDHDDVLPAHALAEIARAIVADPLLDLVYTDEDKIDAKGKRFEPHFKPDWNVELLYAQNYVNHLTVVRRSLVREVGGLRPGFEGSQDHDLLLRLLDSIEPARVRHIPRILYHWRAAIGSGTFSDKALVRAEAARLASLADLVARRGMQARVVRGPLGFNRLVRALPEPPPLVSVVIPTRDRAELLSVVLEGLLDPSRTEYPAIEVSIVDNGSVEPRTAMLLGRLSDDPRVRVLSSPGPFNFSKLSNEGAAAARGQLLLFLNNDVEIIEPGWLKEMASIAVEPHVGAVGAKLTYPDGTLQHGGVVLGAGGVAGHSHLGIGPDDPGYFGRMVMAQEVSGVTGACLMMRRDVFAQVGGFDETALTIAFNDVDLCLKITREGYRIIWTPHAHLVHHESKSRGTEDTPEKRARFEGEVRTMLERWGPRLRRDPHYNPNLARATAHFRIW